MTLRGKELDITIEKELILMVAEGYDHAPISNKSLYERLKSKGIINGKISTLTSRKELITTYINKQMSEVGGTYGKSLSVGSKQSKASIIRRNAELTRQVMEAKEQVAINQSVLIQIVKTIKQSGSVSNIERLLSPTLIRELNKDI
ncbi:hypothetical protein [Aliivibrio fischeri]|uniref:hypothetical protein n=1 Tax=Aliivibrio fischeri TaxID=668 RepID=UPI0007C4527A|nr:hypothetical protein [Aliivibrio fischeri]MUL16275.1 hypothetical protein [Aliivibrio fischeri]